MICTCILKIKIKFLKLTFSFYNLGTFDLEKASQYLLDSCRPGANVCLICIATVKHTDAVSLCLFYCVTTVQFISH